MVYVHGYTDRETQRLLEQSLILEQLLHTGTRYPEGNRILEVGSGVGAQTRILSKRNPGAFFHALEVQEASLVKARELATAEGISNVEFMHGDLFEVSLDPESYDHVFVCFVLEHLSQPDRALRILFDALKTGGTVTVVEGDHGSGFWTPETIESRHAWEGLIRSQKDLGHDPNIGRRVYPLLSGNRYAVQYVTPRWVYADQSNPELLDGVINKIIAPMVRSAEDNVLESGYMDKDAWIRGLADIESVARHPEGTFFYTWFKGVGIKQ